MKTYYAAPIPNGKSINVRKMNTVNRNKLYAAHTSNSLKNFIPTRNPSATYVYQARKISINIPRNQLPNKTWAIYPRITSK